MEGLCRVEELRKTIISELEQIESIKLLEFILHFVSDARRRWK